jgi:hypothetical protein
VPRSPPPPARFGMRKTLLGDTAGEIDQITIVPLAHVRWSGVVGPRGLEPRTYGFKIERHAQLRLFHQLRAVRSTALPPEMPRNDRNSRTNLSTVDRKGRS